MAIRFRLARLEPSVDPPEGLMIPPRITCRRLAPIPQYSPDDIDPPTFQFVDYPGRNCLLGEDRSFNTFGVGSTSDDRLSHEGPEGVDDVQLVKKFAIARQQA
jgi:hypothetical protein